jgi:O-antigen ligase/Flp pilus assembly protein TadD
MRFVAASLRWQRGLLTAGVAGSALVFWRGTLDVFNTTKATWILLCVIAVAAVGAARIYRTRIAVLPPRVLWLPAVVMAVALVVATLTSETVMLSVVGRSGRHTGLAMYLAYLAVMLVAARTHREASPIRLIAALLIAAVPVVGYGALQVVGIEPFDWRLIEGGPPVFATFGNANFFSAWLGIVAPMALAGALLARWGRWVRAGCGVMAAAALVVAYFSDSLQGVAAGGAGVGVVTLVALFTHERARRWRWYGVGAVGVLGAGVVGLVAARLGPFAAVADQLTTSLETRLGKWETALRMAGDHPLVGLGLNDFADYFHAYRPQWLATEDGLERTTDTPHNVPLDMLTSGGVLLLAAYVVLVVVTAWALVRGLRHLDGQQRLLLGGMGGAWVAYQLQSYVSIDVPPLAVLHYTLAGLIIAFGLAPAWREWRLPGAPAPAPPKGKRAKKKPAGQPLVPLRAPAIAAIVVVAGVAAWAVTVPWRADAAAQTARQAAADGRLDIAEGYFDEAVSMASWQPRYPSRRGTTLGKRGEAEAALAAFDKALSRQPRGLSHAINLARQAVALDRIDRARRAYEQAMDIDPKTPEVLAEVGQFHLDHGSPETARRLLEDAVGQRADQARWWLALAQARAATGDEPGAQAARERAVEIDPDVERAADA